MGQRPAALILEVLTVPNAEAEVPPQQGDKKKKPEPFHLAEKIGEMVDYGYPLTMSFLGKTVSWPMNFAEVCWQFSGIALR